MTEECKVTYMRDYKSKVVKSIGWIKCEFCGKEICLTTTKLSKCSKKCRKNNKFVYLLKKDNGEFGFSGVNMIEVDNFRKANLKYEK